jgi:hypothetical protein
LLLSFKGILITFISNNKKNKSKSGKTKIFIKLTNINLLLQIILNSYKTAINIKIINTGNTGLPRINNVTKINDKSTVEKSLNLKFLTLIKFLIFELKLIFIPHNFYFF